MLIGRERERQRLAAILEDARRGRSTTLIVVGGPGVGKTALLDDTREAAQDMTRLTAAGAESESELPFASLHELIRPLLPLLSEIPQAQRRAVSAALALAEGNANMLAVGAGVLSLLVAAADERPVLLCLDDVHWFDQASAEAVAFAARRIRAEPIAVVAALRPGVDSAFDRFPRLDVGPLGHDEARALLRTRPLPSGAHQSILAAAAGNPLVLLELPAELATQLPLATTQPHNLERAFLQRLAELPDDTRQALLLAASEPDGETVRLAMHARWSNNPLAAAEEAGLVRVDGGTVLFRHPVVRSLVYARASTQDRAAAHRALAEVLSRPADADRCAWHLGAAADRPDETVATMLEQTAERAIVRGGHAAAAQALDRSARLSPGKADRARRLSLAASNEAAGGQIARARALIDEALPLADDPPVRFDLLCQLRALAEWTEGRESEATLLHELDTLPGLDDDRRLRLLVVLTNQHLNRFDAAGAVALIPRIERSVPGASPEGRARGRAIAGAAHLLAGNRAEAIALHRATEHPAIPTMIAFDYLSLEWFDELRTSLSVTLAEARQTGNLHRIMWNRSCAAHLELRHGRLDAAEAAAAEAVRLGELLDDPKTAVAHGALAAVYAWRGNVEPATTHAHLAAAGARAAGDRASEGLAQSAVALLALGQGRPLDAIAALEPLAEAWAESSAADPAATPYIPDLIEAYVLTGAAGQARALLDHFTAVANAAGNVWLLAACARCEGLLSTTAEFEAPFGQALGLLEPSPYTLELARTRLALGERRRRARRRRDARPPLEAALDTFARAGALPWHQRAAAELRVMGVHVSTPPPPRGTLTPQELAIAALAAAGSSNKEIATSIYLSPKTVEFHLAKIFRKLQIHSRVELARLMATRTDDPQ